MNRDAALDRFNFLLEEFGDTLDSFEKDESGIYALIAAQGIDPTSQAQLGMGRQAIRLLLIAQRMRSLKQQWEAEDAGPQPINTC